MGVSINFLIGLPLRDVVCASSSAVSRFSNAQDDAEPSLVFDVGILDIKNPFILRCDSGEEVNFKSIVGCTVTNIFRDNMELIIIFDGRISLRVSLREEDYIGPDAVLYKPNNR